MKLGIESRKVRSQRKRRSAPPRVAGFRMSDGGINCEAYNSGRVMIDSEGGELELRVEQIPSLMKLGSLVLSGLNPLLLEVTVCQIADAVLAAQEQDPELKAAKAARLAEAELEDSTDPDRKDA